MNLQVLEIKPARSELLAAAVADEGADLAVEPVNARQVLLQRDQLRVLLVALAARVRQFPGP